MVDERIISAAAGMDAVTLQVRDLEGMSRYYSRAFAMEPIEERAEGSRVSRVLGNGGVPMVRLIKTPDLPDFDPHQAGLFHTAFLFPTQHALAEVVFRAAQQPETRFAGTGDHLVSEAFYFTDPEGNGVELYYDRPRSQWTYTNGQVDMATLRLDPNAYLAKHLAAGTGRGGGATQASGPVGAHVGHVHLQVGAIAPARKFYVDALGFEVTADSMPSALFTSAGGYHHHLAMNVWNSRGAGPRAASLGLANVAVTVPALEDLDALTARLARAKIEYSFDGQSVTTKDPWGTAVTVSLPGASVDAVLSRKA
ncbi:VOC family protein [Ancrocorticia sp.]|uniref:VOC family protein n=1 Tax=Ancrocorticia sp. TaxID=2593684 RepID=UPI003F921CB3